MGGALKGIVTSRDVDFLGDESLCRPLKDVSANSDIGKLFVYSYYYKAQLTHLPKHCQSELCLLLFVEVAQKSVSAV